MLRLGLRLFPLVALQHAGVIDSLDGTFRARSLRASEKDSKWPGKVESLQLHRLGYDLSHDEMRIGQVPLNLIGNELTITVFRNPLRFLPHFTKNPSRRPMKVVTLNFVLAIVLPIVRGSAIFSPAGVLPTDYFLLVLSGVVTAAPIVALVAGMKHVPFKTVGTLQYIVPTLMLLCSVVWSGKWPSHAQGLG